MKTQNNRILSLALAWAALAVNLFTIQKAQAASFITTGSMSTNRVGHTATLLPSGKVLVAGGQAFDALSSSELYDPATGSWTLTGALRGARSGHSATLLSNGKVLVAGGWRESPTGAALSSAEVYDPATGTWAATGALKTARMEYTATLLPNGKVLVAGGQRVDGSALLSSAELYDPATGTWAATGALSDARTYHGATLLPNGKVLVVGGWGLSSAELYDPAIGTWTKTGALSKPHSCRRSATLLASGKVLVAGGGGDAELYDPATGIWTLTGPLSHARSGHSATLLANGKVLVAGGFNDSSAELYDPTTQTWAETGSLSIVRVWHEATLLPGGKVLVTGAGAASTEVYEPDGGGPPPSLTVLRNTDQTVSLSWSGAGTLEQTESLTAPNWQPAPSQANPQTLGTTGAMKFFRVKAE